MQPFTKCTPFALKEVTLQKLRLRYAADSYCKIIDFRTVKIIRVFGCPGADALFAELSKSTTLPEKLESLEVKHTDNVESDGLDALEGFLCLIFGITALTLDFTDSKRIPPAASIVRHGRTLKKLNVHARTSPDSGDDELVYDYVSFAWICNDCLLLEQISIAFSQVSVICNQNEASETCSVCENPTDYNPPVHRASSTA